MTLFSRLTLGVSILFFALLVGVEAIYLANARSELQERLASQAQDAATSLALRLAMVPDLADTVLVETMLGPVFDRGYYGEISVLSPSGAPLARRTLPPSQAGVPAWFVRLLPLEPPGAQSMISTGWRETGRVVVVGHPYFAYQELWRTGWQTLAWLALLYALALGAVTAFLAMLLRPLKEMERVATAVGERHFRLIDAVPKARELARVVLAMNAMSEKIRRFVTEESAHAETLRREAFVDPLTGFHNRRGFEQQLQSLIQSKGDAHAGALVLLEIARFGEYNARVGYQKGDETLAMIAAALAKSWAARVVVGGRLGGAGFAVATVNIDPVELKTLVGALCGNVALLLREQGLDAQLQFHCGAVRCEGALPEYTALLAAADHAVQAAREKGSNVYQIEDFDAASAAGSRRWQALIEKVLAEDRLALYAQDVLGLPEGRPVHSEVTVRMVVDDGAMPAAQFLPMAARHGLIAKLDCRVLEKVLAALAGGVAAPAIAVNLSARTIADAEASRRLLGLLDGAPALARRIVFEITEFGALQDWRGCLAFADQLRGRGARFALDNFSMLQESLMLVHALRPAYIKLSPVYSRDLAKNADCRFLVQSLVRVAQTLDIAVYAQAVEDPGLVPELARLGLSGYQGYAAARPAPFG